MYPGQIPTLEDIQEVLLQKLQPHGIHTGTIMFTDAWRRPNNDRLGRFFTGGNPTASRLIEISAEDYREAVLHTRALVQLTYRDHNMLDELYHWFTSYSKIESITYEGLIARLKHPILVYSAITQHKVRLYAEDHTVQETKELLSNSCVPWSSDMNYPNRKWRQAYQTLGTTNTQWPIASFTTKLNEFARQNVSSQTAPPPPEPFLKQYNAKATDSFGFKFGTTSAFKIPMGIELELENLTLKAQPILTQLLGQHAIFKRDGSVSGGVEICTAPATLDIHKEVFKTFFENKESDLKVEANCGLHVHVERKTIKQTQLAKIMLFMNNPKNNTFIEHIAGRKANTYCQREDHSWASMINTTSGDKYKRVNLAPSTTIEFRLFASTLDYSQFSRCLEFVQAVIDYTKSGEHDCSIKEMTEKEPFMTYIKKNRQYYPELVKFVHPGLIKARPAAYKQGAN